MSYDKKRESDAKPRESREEREEREPALHGAPSTPMLGATIGPIALSRHLSPKQSRETTSFCALALSASITREM